METILDSKTSTLSSESKLARTKAKSEPFVQAVTSSAGVKQQTSAPSYFYSLKENDSPPFIKPEFEPRPKLIIFHIFNEEEVVKMIACAEADKENGLKKCLGRLLVNKKIVRNHDLSERNFLIGLLTETIDYAAQRDFNAFKLSVLLTIYLDSHVYFKWYYWQPPTSVWSYFKEMMIRHTIEDSPYGQEVFSPEECYDIITHFHTVYLTNLPLIHILTFGVYRLKFVWPYVAK